MAASSTDLLTQATTSSRPTPTQVTSTRSAAGATLACNALTGWPTATAVHFCTYKINTSGAKIAGSQIDMKGIVSGTSITNITIKAGTDVGNAVGDIVEASPTAAWANDVVAWGTVEHNQDGTHKISQLVDTSANELIKFTSTGSAVNEVTVANAATTNGPTISATGNDSNIDLRLVPKGTGNVKRGTTGGAIDWWEEIGRTTLGSSGDVITVSSLPTRKYLQLRIYCIATGGTIDLGVRWNNDSTAAYDRRTSSNGAADGTVTGTTSQSLTFTAAAANITAIVDVVNVASSTKISLISATQSASPPNRVEGNFRWSDATNPITRVDVINLAGTGDFAIGSEVIVLGHD